MCNDRIWTLLTRKLSGEATSTELKELDHLLSSLSGNHHSIKEITHIWNNSVPQDHDFMEATYLAHVERMKDKGVHIDAEITGLDEATEDGEKKFKLLSFRNISVLAVGIMLVAGTWFLMNNNPGTATERELVANNLKEVSTKRGNRTKLQLPDGSNVWLNAGSKIRYAKDFDGTERVVYLTGEAFFDVVKNPQKPFIIHTSEIDVRVLGTQFNVKAYEEDNTTETSLIRGSVEVFLKSNPAKKYLLRPNEKLVLSNERQEPGIVKNEAGEKAVTKTADPVVTIMGLSYLDDNENVESSWTRNILSFDDEPFAEVAKKMERWYNVSINFKNEKWQSKYLSGSFENESLDQALAALKFTTGFRFTIEGDKVSIY